MSAFRGWWRSLPTTFPSMGVQFTELRRETDWLRELPYAPVRFTLNYQAEAWKRSTSAVMGVAQSSSPSIMTGSVTLSVKA